MLTLSIVPLTSVVAAVPPDVAPAYCALKVYWPGGACEPLLSAPFHEKLARPADCAPKLTCPTNAPLLSLMFSTTWDVVCGTLTAPEIAPLAAKVAVALVTSAWWPSNEDACSAWLDDSEL